MDLTAGPPGWPCPATRDVKCVRQVERVGIMPLEQGKARAEAEREHRATFSQESVSVGVRAEASNKNERGRQNFSSGGSRRSRASSRASATGVGRGASCSPPTTSPPGSTSSSGGCGRRGAPSRCASAGARTTRDSVATLSAHVTGAPAKSARERTARSASEVREQQQAGATREAAERLAQPMTLFGKLERRRDAAGRGGRVGGDEALLLLGGGLGGSGWKAPQAEARAGAQVLHARFPICNFPSTKEEKINFSHRFRFATSRKASAIHAIAAERKGSTL